MKKIIIALLFILMNLCSLVAEDKEIPLDVVNIKTLHLDNERIRIIIRETGWENITSSTILEWQKIENQGKKRTVIAKTTIPELQFYTPISIDSTETIDDYIELTISTKHAYTYEDAIFTLYIYQNGKFKLSKK